MVWDITETIEAGKALRQLVQALEEMGESVIITDLEGRIKYLNQATEETYGYPVDELLGQSVSLLQGEHEDLFFEPEIREASLSRGWQGEILGRRKDGVTFPVFLTTSLLRDGKGHPEAILRIVRDIGERKKREQEMLRRNRELAFLNAITTTMSQSLKLQETLEEAVEKITEALGLDGGEIYLKEANGAPFQLTQVVCKGMEKDYHQQVSFSGIRPFYSKPMAITGQPITVNDLEEGTIYPSLLSQGFRSFASIPIESQGAVLGVLNMASREGGTFDLTTVGLLYFSANQMGMFIGNVRSFQREKRRVEELSSLIQVAQAVNSSLDLEKVLESIVAMSAKMMNAPMANLMLVDEVRGELQWSADVGLPTEWAGMERLKVGESLSGLVVSTKAPLAVLEISQDPRFRFPDMAIKHGLRSFLGVPLIFREKAIGGLYICTTEPHHFSEKEISLLEALASQAAMAIENARLFQEAEKLASENLRRFQEVSTLNEMGAAMRSVNQLDQLLPIILTGATCGGGLGFNRAILFLMDERKEFLEGVLGIGPSSSEEAHLIWSQMEGRRSSLSEIIRDISLDSLAQSPFNLLAQTMKIPMVPQGGIVALTALEGKAIHIPDVSRSELPLSSKFEGHLGAAAFATVPLLIKEEVIGVIMVDNLYNGRPISEDDIRFLSAMANQAVMAIEAVRLYSQLEKAHRQLLKSHHQMLQMERLATLGEMSATIAHQVRNPLVSIGGFARRLSQMNPENGVSRQYLEIIQREVSRLEEIVKGILSVTREIPTHLFPSDLNQIVRECLHLYQDQIKGQRIRLQTHFQRSLPPIPLDPTQIQQALSNLINNALEAMPEGGNLMISTSLSPEAAQIEIADTGPGIPPEAQGLIFDPFFTTKANGTGLGLTLAQRIISNHGGRVEVKDSQMGGATFLVILPMNRRPLGSSILGGR